MEEKDLVEFVRKRLSERRFKHSIGVMERAGELAEIYKYDIEKARKTALIHDIAKELSKNENLKYIEENNIKIDEIEKDNLWLIHGKIGADIAKKIFNFSDDMCEAIRVHTTGKIKMSLLDKIIYVADKTESGRKNENENIDYLIKLSNKDLDEAVLFILDNTIKESLEKRKIIHIDSINARNYLIKNDK